MSTKIDYMSKDFKPVWCQCIVGENRHLLGSKSVVKKKGCYSPYDTIKLTKRDLCVLQLLADGYVLPQIYKILEISSTEARYCKDKAREILKAKTTTAAVVTALRLGLIS